MRGLFARAVTDTGALDGPKLISALDSIQGSRIKQHMSVLADDRLEGRGLGSAGYDGALAYVETTLKSYGLQPAGDHGGFHQRVPLRNSIVTEGTSSMTVRFGAKTKTRPTARITCLARTSCRRGEYRGCRGGLVGYGVRHQRSATTTTRPR